MVAYYDAYNSGDEAGLTSLLAPDIRLISAQGEISGLAAYLSLYRYMTSLFVDHMTPNSIEVEGDKALVQIENSLTAKHDIADFMGMSFKNGENITLLLKGTYMIKNQQIIGIDKAII